MGEHPRFWLAFGILLTAFAFFTVMSVYMVTAAHASTGPVPQVIDIQDDHGGSVGEYYRKYKSLSDAGTEIHFHGMCASSCTMVLFQEFTGIKACAYEGTLFAFHKPFSMKGDKIDRSKKARRETREVWAMWLESLRPGLRKYLRNAKVPSASYGDEPNVMLILPGGMLLPKCEVSQ